MSNSKEFGSFKMAVDGREWSVDVATEAAEDSLQVESISGDDLDAWVDDNSVFLSDIAQAKIKRGECGPDWVRITSGDLHP